MGKFDGILNDGKDFDMSKICSCDNHSMDWCEKNCGKYYSCDSIAMADDILKEYENRRTGGIGMDKNTVWTLFVLDFDGTYDMEEPDCEGNKPTVYLIPADRQRDVEHYARMAHDDFHSDENGCMTITDYFHEWMDNNNCDYKIVGEIDLTFEERQVDYLVDYIPREIV